MKWMAWFTYIYVFGMIENVEEEILWNDLALWQESFRVTLLYTLSDILIISHLTLI